MRPQSLLLAAMTCLTAACGDKDTSTTGGTTASPAAKLATANAQPAQASADAADSAGSSDSQTAQGGSGASKAVRMVHSALMAEQSLQAAQVIASSQIASSQNANGQMASSQMASRVTGSFEFQGCRAHLEASTDGNSYSKFGGHSFDSNSQVALHANVVIDPNSCAHGRRLHGDQIVHALYQDGNRFVEVTDNVTMMMRDGDTVTITSADPTLPTYVLQSSHLAGMGNVELVASLNEHRTRTTAEGNVIFDLTVQTDPNQPLDIINYYAQDANNAAIHTRNIVAGTATVTHKITGNIYKHTFRNLSRTTTGCSCPTSGEMDEMATHADKSTTSRTYVFTGCGTANVSVTASTDPNQIVGTKSVVTFDSCD